MSPPHCTSGRISVLPSPLTDQNYKQLAGMLPQAGGVNCPVHSGLRSWPRVCVLVDWSC